MDSANSAITPTSWCIPSSVITLDGGQCHAMSAWHSGEEWLAACVAGLVLWTFLEYAIHRIALHRMPVFSPMHSLHHGEPLAYIGTPSWVSVSVWLGVVLLPSWWCAGFNVADGLTVGLMVGYWWYGYVHHVIHHHARKPSSTYFSELRAWHMRHHHSPEARQLRRHHPSVGLCVRHRHFRTEQSHRILVNAQRSLDKSHAHRRIRIRRVCRARSGTVAPPVRGHGIAGGCAPSLQERHAAQPGRHQFHHQCRT